MSLKKQKQNNLRKFSHQELQARQKEKYKTQKLSLCVVLNSIRSLHNVGSIFRTCDAVGVEKLYLCGITGYPPNQQLAKTALDAQKYVPWEYREDLLKLVDELKAEHYTIVLLEQIEGGLFYQNFKPKGKVCLIVGNEVSGIADELVEKCDTAIEIEMMGVKNSLNVSVAFGIVAYHIKHQIQKKFLVLV